MGVHFPGLQFRSQPVVIDLPTNYVDYTPDLDSCNRLGDILVWIVDDIGEFYILYHARRFGVHGKAFGNHIAYHAFALHLEADNTLQNGSLSIGLGSIDTH